ncbi:MAG: YqgE/AlgH family protein [Alphaproteobacteria bacterium]|nr:YqgE/AlgH family protein [Alphaproteobacteria bacterium]
MSMERLKPQRAQPGYLSGQMLIAMPSMRDERFERSVIYICAHSAEGAWGLAVNRRSRRLTFADLLVQLDIIKAADTPQLPPRIAGISVLRGGPVERGRGFVLHSDEYRAGGATLDLLPGVCLTATVDILRDIAKGEGPQQPVMALGYAGWGPGQLDQELQANAWLTCEADRDFIFSADLEGKYARALGKIGIDPALLSSQAGHA